MTNNELISGTRLLLRSLTDDSIYTDQAIYDMHISARSVLLSRKLKKMETVSSSNYITICLVMNPSCYNDCDCDTFDCIVAKSIDIIPPTINSRNYEGLKVKTVDGTNIPKIGNGGLSQHNTSLTSRNGKMGWELYNNKLIIHNNTKIPLVLGEGLFYDPVSIAQLKSCSEDTGFACYNPHTDDFPIDPELVSPMRSIVLETLALTSKIPDDRFNNAMSDNNV